MDMGAHLCYFSAVLITCEPAQQERACFVASKKESKSTQAPETLWGVWLHVQPLRGLIQSWSASSCFIRISRHFHPQPPQNLKAIAKQIRMRLNGNIRHIGRHTYAPVHIRVSCFLELPNPKPHSDTAERAGAPKTHCKVSEWTVSNGGCECAGMLGFRGTLKYL